MSFCSNCGAKIQSEAQFCSSCGTNVASQISNTTVQVESTTEPNEKTNQEAKVNTFEQKLHIILISAASIAVVLLYTTINFGLIGITTGICFGLSLRLFFSHKKNDFHGTSKLDWILLASFSTLAFILMLAGVYNIQAIILIFVAVRSLMMYLKMTSHPIKSA